MVPFYARSKAMYPGARSWMTLKVNSRILDSVLYLTVLPNANTRAGSMGK